MAFRAMMGLVPLAERLADHFTVYTYDRRGRGESTDAAQENGVPFAIEREIEDLEALIDRAGGSAGVFGISSGAALVLEAALTLGDKVKKIALYEAPYNSDDTAMRAWREYGRRLDALLAENRPGDAVGLFMMLVGASDTDVENMRQSPMWPVWESVAPTLAYDRVALGDDAAVPVARAAGLSIPALVLNGGASFPFMHGTAAALAKAMPHGQHQTLQGQTHDVEPEALAPVLAGFFNSNPAGQ
jgi:pimeloyl-ACP methyl ester carboxylesterase